MTTNFMATTAQFLIITSAPSVFYFCRGDYVFVLINLFVRRPQSALA